MDIIISKRRKKRHTQQLLVHSVSEIQWAHIASSWFRVHLFIYLYQCWQGFFPQWVIILSSYYLFRCSMATDLASGRNFKLAPVSFGFVPIILWTFPCFLVKMFPAHLVLSLPQPWNWPFTRKWWVLLTFWHSFFHSPLLSKSALNHPGDSHLISLSSLYTYFLSGLRYSHDFWICISIPISSSNCQTCICNCPLDSSNPMSHRHLKFNRLKLNLFTLPPSQT